MDVLVRRAKLDDLAQLQKLGTELMLSDRRFDSLQEKQWYFSDEGRQYLLKNIRGRNRVCLLAEIRGMVIGYATARVLTIETWRPVKRVELTNLIVTDRYRNHGIGHQLVAAFKEWGRGKGAVRFKVMTYALNKNAKRFYEDNGFSVQLLTLEADA
jgi:GNAT superfamily N-acetyltransferase